MVNAHVRALALILLTMAAAAAGIAVAVWAVTALIDAGFAGNGM